MELSFSKTRHQRLVAVSLGAVNAGALLAALLLVSGLRPEDRISVRRGAALSALGLAYFWSLFSLLAALALRTAAGARARRRHRLSAADALDVANKLVSAVQAALSCAAGAVVCAWSCARDFLRTSHYMSEAYAWFGAAYFFYDIWSMYTVSVRALGDGRGRDGGRRGRRGRGGGGAAAGGRRRARAALLPGVLPARPRDPAAPRLRGRLRLPGHRTPARRAGRLRLRLGLPHGAQHAAGVGARRAGAAAAAGLGGIPRQRAGHAAGVPAVPRGGAAARAAPLQQGRRPRLLRGAGHAAAGLPGVGGHPAAAAAVLVLPHVARCRQDLLRREAGGRGGGGGGRGGGDGAAQVMRAPPAVGEPARRRPARRHAGPHARRPARTPARTHAGTQGRQRRSHVQTIASEAWAT